MSKIDATVLKDGQLAVATLDQSGTLISGASAIDTTCLVQTDDGVQQCVKTFPLGEGGGGGTSSGADTSLSNLTAAGKIQVAHLAMPSSTVDELTFPVGLQSYVAPADGYFFLQWRIGASTAFVGISTDTYELRGRSNTAEHLVSVLGPVKKGQSADLETNGTGSTSTTRNKALFIYAVGSESEHTPQP